MDMIAKVDPSTAKIIQEELKRQEDRLQMIASENYASKAVMAAQGSVLTNKYAEGYPRARYYQGCQFYDEIEQLAIDRAQKLFGAEHANVQPHAGAQANAAVFFGLLKPGETVLGMDLAAGGHLSHGQKFNFSGRYFNAVSYGVHPETCRIDMAEIRRLAEQHKPRLIIAGGSAYPRIIDFSAFAEVARSVGASLLVDMAHIAGLIAAGVHPSPVPHAEFITTTTHKTLRGPRGGMILCRKDFGKKIDSAVFPGLQGGPLMHVIAAKAVAFHEALQPSFKKYQRQVVKNCAILAEALMEKGYQLVSGGTDNHLLLVDLRQKGVSGADAATALETAGITVNKNRIPFDPQNAVVTSGLRIGTPAITSRGMKEPEIRQIAAWIDEVIRRKDDSKFLGAVSREVGRLCRRFPIYK